MPQTTKRLHDAEDDEPAVIKLTDWANEPNLDEFKANVKNAKPEHQALVSQVEAWLATMSGGAKITKVVGKSSIRSKITKKQAEWLYASLSEPFLSSTELFTAQAVSADDEDFVQEAQQILNFHIQHNFDLTEFIDELVRVLVTEGTGILKTYWENTTATDGTEDIPEIVVLPTGEEQIVGWTKQDKVVSITDNPNVEICSFRDVIVDPTCKGKMNKCQFIAHEFEMSMGGLEADGRYKNLSDIPETASTNNSEIESSQAEESNFEFKHKTNKKIKVVEYWGFFDIHDNGTLEPIVCAWVGNVMIRLELNPYADKQLPFIFIPYSPIKNSFYGESIAELTEDSQKVVGAMTRGILDMLGRSSNAQTIAKKGIFDAVNARRFERGEDCYINEHADIRDDILQHTFPEIPNSALQVINMQTNEVESFTGVRPFALHNGSDSIGESATATRSSMDATAKRELATLRRIAKGMVTMGNKFLAMCADLMEEAEILRITGNEHSFLLEQSRVKYDIELKISTPEADQNKIDKLSFMMQTAGGNTDPGEIRLIRAKIARLQKLPDLAKQIEEYTPEPDPLEQKKAMLEIALLEAKVQNENAKGLENQMDITLKAAKTRLLEAQADKQDLDYVEQESGVTRAQEDKVQDKQLYADMAKDWEKQKQ